MEFESNDSIDESPPLMHRVIDEVCASNQKNSSLYRDELEKYVKYLTDKKGSDGKPLVNMPANFSLITDSMNREDLKSTKTTPWCQYLFQENFDKVLKEEFGGRYDSLSHDSSDTKIQKGLAQIHLLDRQLEYIMKKDIVLEKRNIIDNKDGTFLTKRNEDQYDNSSPDREQELSNGNYSISPKRDQLPTKDPKDFRHQLPSPTGGGKFTDQAISSTERMRNLLDSSEDDLFTADNDEYLGALREVRDRNVYLDEQLSKYGRLDRLQGVSDDKVRSAAELNGRDNDYITLMVRGFN